MTAILVLAVFAAVTTPVAPADLVIRNARVYTATSTRPLAQALAVTHGRIVALGEDSAVLPYLGAKTRVLDTTRHSRALCPTIRCG